MKCRVFPKWLILIVCLQHASVFAAPIDDEVMIVVSPNRYETEAREVASSVRVFTEEQIEDQKLTDVSELLRQDPSLNVVRSGGPGGNVSVSIRGANPEHTLVLLDGIEMNNPVLPGRTFNFADFLADNIERVEILRGPQSVLYGSDALGGIVSMTTKRASGPAKLTVLSEAGSYNTYVERVGLHGGTSLVDYSLGFGREDTQGISAASAAYGNDEKDGYGNSAFSGRFGLNPSDDIRATAVLRVIESVAELDNFGGAAGDDPNRELDNTQIFTAGSLQGKFFDELLKSTVSYNYTNQRFEDDNDPDVLSQDFLRSDYKGLLSTVNLINELNLSKSDKILAGLETQTENASSHFSSDGAFGPFTEDFARRSATTNAYFLSGQHSFNERLVGNAGVRIDDGSQFGSEVTWRIAPVILFPEHGLRLKGTLGTGYKAPSLLQLYSSFGDPSLNPEKSLGVDAGIEKTFEDYGVVLSTTYFHQDFDELVSFDPSTFRYQNLGNATTSGVETDITVGLAEQAELRLGYTYLDATNDDDGSSLLRRAKNRVQAELKLNPTDKISLVTTFGYVGNRFDNDFTSATPQRVELSGFPLVAATLNYQVTPQIQVFTRIENLLDREYEEVLGYGTLGSVAMAGIKVSLGGQGGG